MSNLAFTVLSIQQGLICVFLLLVKQPVHFPVGLNISSISDVTCSAGYRCVTCIKVWCRLHAGGMLHRDHWNVKPGLSRGVFKFLFLSQPE